MLATSGFGWNDTEKRIDVENDSVWEAYVWDKLSPFSYLHTISYKYFNLMLKILIGISWSL